MGYRLKGTLKLPDGTPATNCEMEFASRRNYTPILQSISASIMTNAAGAYDVTLEFGSYAVILKTGTTYPTAIGGITVALDTPAGQDLPSLLQHEDWRPATPEYIQQITEWLASAESASATAVNAANAAKVSETNAKASEVAAEKDRSEVATNTATVNTKTAQVVTLAAQVSSDASTTQSARNEAVSAASQAKADAASASSSAASAAADAIKAEQAAATVVGALIDAGPYDASTGVLPIPVMTGTTKQSSIWKVTKSGIAGGIDLSVGDSLVYTSRDDSYYKIDNTESFIETLQAAALPFPDVWIPLNDSLRMLAGFGDEVRVGDYTVATQATLTRNSGATLINKGGALVNAGINESRFEKKGLLIEGQSTNIMKYSVAPASMAGGTFRSSSFKASVNSEKEEFVFTRDGAITTSGWFSLTTTDFTNQAGSYTGSVFVEKCTFPEDTIVRCSLWSTVQGQSDVEIGRGENVNVYELVGKRFSVSGESVPESARVEVRVNIISRGDIFTGDELIVLKHPQIEALAFATSYTPTNGAAATRDTDKLTIPRLNNECVEWYSGADPITPIVTANTIELVPPAGELHLRNVRGFFTPLTPEQKASLK